MVSYPSLTAPNVAELQPGKVRKLVITGIGRSGTTFLVQLLTQLGLDTGYTECAPRSDYHPHCSAGLERDIRDSDAPYIIKNPALCTRLEGILAEGWLHIDHVLVPMRDLSSAHRSRVRVGGINGEVPGGVLGPNPEGEKAVLTEMFFSLMITLTRHQIPHTLLEFPRLVNDVEYAWEKLRGVLCSVTRPQFEAAFRKIARPELVHTFETAPSADEVRERREAFLRGEARKRLRRKVRRVATALLIAAASATLVGQVLTT